MIIPIYIYLFLIHILSVKSAKSVDCESIGNENQCKSNNQCQWCNQQWGCMELKNISLNIIYECPKGIYFLIYNN